MVLVLYGFTTVSRRSSELLTMAALQNREKLKHSMPCPSVD